LPTGVQVLFQPLTQSPQSVGDIISQALRVYRTNIKLVLQKLIAPVLCASAAALAIQWCMSAGIKSDVLTKDASKGIFFAIAIFVSIIIFLISSWIVLIRQLAFVRLITNLSPDYSSALGFVWKRAWSIIGLYAFLMGFFFFVFFFIIALAVVPAIFIKNTILITIIIFAVLALSILVILLSTLFYAIALCMAVCENLSIGGIISRTIQFTNKNLKRAALFTILLLIIQSILGWMIYLPIGVLVLFDMFREGISSSVSKGTYDVPFYLKTIEQAAESMASMLIAPIHYFAFGLFYFDLRMRKEGIDIEGKLKTLEEQIS
jgi:hypothetical protein